MTPFQRESSQLDKKKIKQKLRIIHQTFFFLHIMRTNKFPHKIYSLLGIFRRKGYLARGRRCCDSALESSYFFDCPEKTLHELLATTSADLILTENDISGTKMSRQNDAPPFAFLHYLNTISV